MNVKPVTPAGTRHNFLIYGILFIIVYFQNRYVGFYHDDYAYAVLSYAIGEPVGPFNFANVMQYFHWHYLHWVGRILFLFFGVCAMQLGMQGFMLVQSIIVSLTLFISYKTILLLINTTTQRAQFFVIAFLVAFYLSINTWIYIDSMYWAAASTSYVWPLLCLLGGMYILFNAHATRNVDRYAYIVAAVCFFMAGFSQEQVALAALAAVPCMAFFVFGRRSVQYKTLLLVAFTAALAGFILLYVAPGNYVRMVAKNEPMPSLPTIFMDIPQNTIFILKIIGKSGSIILFLTSVTVCIRAMRGSLIARKTMPFLCMACVALAVIYIAPIKGARMLYPAVFLLSCAATVCLVDCTLQLIKNKHTKIAVLCCCVFTALAMGTHFQKTFYGYYKNYPAVLANDKNLRAIAQHPEKTRSILFYRLPDLQFAGCMPYDSRPYIERWIRQYYGLPSHLPFTYEAFPR